MSCSTMTAPEVSAALTDATVTAKKCWRRVPVTISVSTRGSPFKTSRTASISSVWRTTSTSALPDCGGTSRPRISAKPRLAKSRRSEAFTTATPSTMLPRMAEERLRSSVSVRMVRSSRAAVSLNEIARAIRFQRTKIAFGYPAGKHLQALHAPRERPGNQQRSDAGEEKHDHRCQPKPAAEFPKLLVHGLERQGKAQNHGRTASNG